MIKTTLAAAALCTFSHLIATAQIEGLPNIGQSDVAEGVAQTLPEPKEKGKIEPYPKGHFHGFRLDDSVLVEAKFERRSPFHGKGVYRIERREYRE